MFHGVEYNTVYLALPPLMDVYVSDFLLLLQTMLQRNIFILRVDYFSRLDTEKKFMIVSIFKIIIVTYQFALKSYTASSYSKDSNK